jgi:hypothetical protein
LKKKKKKKKKKKEEEEKEEEAAAKTALVKDPGTRNAVRGWQCNAETCRSYHT